MTYACPALRDAITSGQSGRQVLDLAGQFDAPPKGIECHAIAW